MDSCLSFGEVVVLKLMMTHKYRFCAKIRVVAVPCINKVIIICYLNFVNRGHNNKTVTVRTKLLPK